MALTPSETLVKSAGDVYVHTAETAAPAEDGLDDATLTTASWVHVGWLGESGPTLEGFEGETTRHFGWNAVKPARTTNRVTEPTVTVPLAQWNAANLSLYFPGATHDAVPRTLTVPDAGTITDKALLIVVRDGTAQEIGLWFSRTSPRPGGTIEFPGDGLSEIPVAFDVLTPTSGDSFVLVGIDVAA